jgi:hypothetical protein
VRVWDAADGEERVITVGSVVRAVTVDVRGRVVVGAGAGLTLLALAGTTE